MYLVRGRRRVVSPGSWSRGAVFVGCDLGRSDVFDKCGGVEVQDQSRWCTSSSGAWPGRVLSRREGTTSGSGPLLLGLASLAVRAPVFTSTTPSLPTLPPVPGALLGRHCALASDWQERARPGAVALINRRNSSVIQCGPGVHSTLPGPAAAQLSTVYSQGHVCPYL